MRVIFMLFALTLIGEKFVVAQSWQSIVTASSSNQQTGKSIKLKNNKQYFLGEFESTINVGFNSLAGVQYSDIFFGKADLNGYTEWIKGISGTGIDQASDIEVAQGVIYVSGTYTGTLYVGDDTLNTIAQRAPFLAAFDTLGNYLWTFNPSAHNAEFRDIIVDSLGNLLLIGDVFQYFNYPGINLNSITGLNFFLLKYDPVADSVLWSVAASGNTSEGMRISTDAFGDIYCMGLYNDGTTFIDTLINTGNVNHNFFVSKFDDDGNKLWVRTIEGTQEVHGYGIVADSLGSVFISGEYQGSVSAQGNTLNSQGDYDVIIAKFNTNGTIQWVKSLGGVYSDEGYDIEIDRNGDPIILAEAGQDPLFDGATLSTSGWDEPMIFKLSSNNGDLIWHKRLESTINTGFVEGKRMSVEGNYIAITGANRSSILMNGQTYNAPNTQDFYSAILVDSLTYYLGSSEDNFKDVLNLYPNPATYSVVFESNRQIEELMIYSIEGKLLVLHTQPTLQHPINIENWAIGIYPYKVRINNEWFVGKIKKL